MRRPPEEGRTWSFLVHGPHVHQTSDMYCYRDNDDWNLSDGPGDKLCCAWIAAKEGPLPVGAHTWRVPGSVVGKPCSSFVDVTLTVTPQ